ncbi:MAG: cation:proton antiporter [Pseudomonadota bacterium]
MKPDVLVQFILSLGLLLLAAIAAGYLARRFRMPTVIGELAAGILLGPTVLGIYWPELNQLLFASSGEVAQARGALLNISSILLLFVIGLEIDLHKIRELRNTIVWTSLSGFAFPFVLGVASIFLFPGIWNYSSDTNKWLLPLFIGTALSISALPVIARVLLDLGLLKSKIGSIILASATIDDLLGWILFAILVANFSTGEQGINPALSVLGIFVMFGLALTVGRTQANKLTTWSEAHPSRDNTFLSITLVLILITAAIAEKIGIHAILGAFVVGIAFSNPETNRMHEVIKQIVIAFFAPLYFVAVGLQVNFLEQFDIVLVLFVVGIATVGKVLGVFAGAKIAKVDTREALAIGFGMNARGAVGIILATSAYQARLIDERIFVALIVMAMVTTLISGPLMKLILHKTTP